jgi:DNA replication protein DnaC
MRDSTGRDHPLWGMFLREYNIPQHYWTATLENIDSPFAAAGRNLMENFRDHLVSKNRPLEDYPADPSTIGRGLIFSGAPGAGKTHSAIATALDIAARYGRSVRPYYLPAAEFIETYHARMDLSSDSDEWWALTETIDNAEQSGLLVLDDMGKEHRAQSGYSVSLIDSLLRRRHDNGRPTIITSNFRPHEWGSEYSKAMESFLVRAFDKVSWAGK